MDGTRLAELFDEGGNQVVHLPEGIRLPGDRVRVRRVGRGVLLEPLIEDTDELFAALDRYRDVPFMEDGRDQPPMPADESLFG